MSAATGSQPACLRRPTLSHKLEQMRQRVLVTATFLHHELIGTFFELRGHLRGLFRRAAHRHKQLCELVEFHHQYELTAILKKYRTGVRPAVISSHLAFPDTLLLFLQFSLEPGAVVGQLCPELIRLLVLAMALGLGDFVLQGKFALSDFGCVLGIKFGEGGFLSGGKLDGWSLFLQAFHGEFVGGFHLG